MNELSLFSGAGGSLLATKHLLKWRTVGYVEFNKYCQQVLAQRIKEEFLDEAPIFGDINGFIESGVAKKYKGYVDVVTAGFPCTPHSTAGRRLGKEDPRNLWPQTLAVIRLLRPRYAFLENVPGLLTVNAGEMFAQILSDLAEIGFDARWTCLGADDVGAPHRRKRLWILAYTRHTESPRRIQVEEGQQPGTGGETWGQPTSRGMDVADSDSLRRSPNEAGRNTRALGGAKGQTQEGGAEQAFPPHSSSEDEADSDSAGQSASYWPTEPNVGRVAHGVAHRVDRLKALGNGQVPRVAATAWELLSG